MMAPHACASARSHFPFPASAEATQTPAAGATLTGRLRTALLAIALPAAVGLLPACLAHAQPRGFGDGVGGLRIAESYAADIAVASQRFGIPPAWIEAVMRIESFGQARAISPKGAMGLMQIMPATYSALRARHALGPDPFTPRDNILAGAAYLRELHSRYGWPGLLAAYNAGPGRYETHLTTGRPLPVETQRYVAAIAKLVTGDQRNVQVALAGEPTPATKPASSGARIDSRMNARVTGDLLGLVPQSDGLFVRLASREPQP